MFGLHWFHHITMDTKVRDIGWFYVFLAALLIFLIVCGVKLVKDWKR